MNETSKGVMNERGSSSPVRVGLSFPTTKSKHLSWPLGYVMSKCHYCGRENQNETAPCTGCGTPPTPGPDEVQGEPGRPVSAMGLLDCAVGVAEIAAGHLGGVVHLVSGVSKLDSPTDENSPRRLLERAAVLESVDMRQAVNLYKWIVLKHPGTPAAEEANRNVQTLRAAHPESENVPIAPSKD